MWWLVSIEDPDLGDAVAYMGDAGIHQFFTLDGTPIAEAISSYTTLEVGVAQPAWWTSETPPEPVAFWE